MSFRLFTALSLLLVPLSGCIAGVGTMSAESGLSTATDHAASLVDTDLEPVLMGVGSIEPFQHYYDAEDDFEINTYADSDQGDGKIPAWAYVYCVGDDAVVIFQAAGIGVLADLRDGGECDFEGSDYSVDDFAVTDWEVDSDEAADILADHPDWPTPAEDTVTFWGLYQMPGEGEESYPVWEVETGNLDDDEEAYAYARINAQTGEVLHVGTEYPDYDGDIYFAEVEPAQECIETSVDDGDSGIISAVDGMSISIDLPAEGYLQFTLQSSNSVTFPTYTLEGPDGEVDSGTAANYSIVGIGSQPAGQYTLTLDTETADQVSMVLEGTYCA